jgi:ABC-2 type transport system ATP-binding protein
MSAILSVSHLTKAYGSFVAVKDVSFDVPQGQIYGLLGSNGAGKTTTLSMLLGLLTPTSGTIGMFGLSMPKDRAAIAGRINFASPYVDLPGHLSIVENLSVYGRLYNVRDLKIRISELADLLKLSKVMNKSYNELSAGQKTRVSLAKALINKPSLLLLDEPTASLDPDMADWVRGIFETYQRQNNATILLASHNMPEVERLCAHVYMMNEGAIVDQGAPKALIAKYSRATMEEVFLHIARHGALEDVE